VSRDQSLGGIGQSSQMRMRDFLRNPAPQSRNRGFQCGMPAY